jgi:MFS-type transporter involved in bile tolerance (Atg22 family)
MVAVFILWIFCFGAGAIVRNPFSYWFIGALVGMTLGATWVVSRALAISLVPEEKIGEVFGLFNLVGYLSAITGALFWGLFLLVLSPLGELRYRITLFALIIFMVPSVIYLLRIPIKGEIK